MRCLSSPLSGLQSQVSALWYMRMGALVIPTHVDIVFDDPLAQYAYWLNTPTGSSEVSMYHVQPQPDPTAILDNGSELTPLITLKSDAGSVAHIIKDDHCYVLVLDNGRHKDGRVFATPWWFVEAFEASRGLPPLSRG